jgi:CHAD domain-containing protein
VTSTHREVELKFRVPADFDLPDLCSVPGVERVETRPTFTMSNVYYDTPDLRLFRWGITLRRRQGGPDQGWHLKVPVAGAAIDGLARDEIRSPLDSGGLAADPAGDPSPPEEITRIVTAFIRSAPVGPVAALRTERTPTLLLDAAGTPIIEVVDDTVSVLEGDHVVTRFREIEAEALTEGASPHDAQLLHDVSDTLLSAGAVPGTMSKAGAALGPRAVVPAEIPELDWPAASAPAGDVVRAYLAQHARRLLLADLHLRQGLPDAVHQLRVNARRIRSGLKVFEPLLDAAWAHGLRDELGWMASGLGEARDTEVLRERLDAHATELAEPDATLARAVIDTALDARLSAAQAAMGDVVDSDRYALLLDALVDGVRRPPLSSRARESAAEALPPLVARAFRRLDRRVSQLDLATPSEEWHVARIAAKRARYAADAVAPVLGRRVARLADHLAEATETLGTHQDAHVAQEALRAWGATADAPGAFALGRLLALEEAAEMADRVAFGDLWPGVSRAARRAGIT